MSELELPASWARATLGQLCSKIGSGKTPRGGQSAYKTSGIPLIRSQNVLNGKLDLEDVAFIDRKIDDDMRSSRVQPNDVLFNITGGSIGRTCTAPETLTAANVNQHVCILRSKNPEQVLPDFISHYLLSPLGKAFVFQNKKGAARDAITKEQLENLELGLPPLGEQKRIVAKIEATTQRIQEIEKSIEFAEALLTKYRESLLAKAFRGELIPQNPNDEPASKLLERIRPVKASDQDSKTENKFPPVTETEIPFELPTQWQWVRLGEIVSFEGGSQPPKSEFRYSPAPDLIRLVQIRDFKSDDHIVYIPKKLNKRYFLSEDIMIGRYGPPLFQILRGLEGSYNVALMKAVPSKIIDREFLFWFLQEPRIQNDVNKKSERSAGQTGINLSFLNHYCVPLPPIEAQKRIAAFIVSSLRIHDAQKTTFQTLRRITAHLRQSLLQFAFTGRLVPQDASEGTGHDLLQVLQQSKRNHENDQLTHPRNPRSSRKGAKC